MVRHRTVPQRCGCAKPGRESPSQRRSRSPRGGRVRMVPDTEPRRRSQSTRRPPVRQPRHRHSPQDQQGFEGVLSEPGAAIRVGLRGSGGQAAYTSRPSRTAGPMMAATPCSSASTSSGVTTTMSLDAGTPMSARSMAWASRRRLATPRLMTRKSKSLCGPRCVRAPGARSTWSRSTPSCSTAAAWPSTGLAGVPMP